LYLKYTQENAILTKKLKDESNDILTNERKTYYQDQGIDTLKFFYSYFLITIYAICVIGFGVSSFVFPSKFEWKIRVGILVGLILLPFICTWILALIVNSLHKIYSVLPKNAHLSM
jgi:ABC-type transport system involved in cytochrome bd biosynthesis fused ATPase/permease subunit